MFEGSVSEQLHQFLTPRTPTPTPNSNSLPLPLNFALHSPNFNFHPFDSYSATSSTTNHHHHHQIHLHHPHLFLHQSPNPHENGSEKDGETTTAAGSLQVPMDLEVGRENSNNKSILMEDHQHQHQHQHQWSNDELLALLRIRSNIDNGFPESTWEHVSRRLGEVGFRRTAEKCKEKFEEESRYFNHINYNKSCRFLAHELNYHPQDQEDHLLLIHGGNGKPDNGGAVVVVPPEEGEEENEANFRDRDGEEEEEEEDLKNETTKERRNNDNNAEKQESSRSRGCKKRKRKMMRQKEFEMLKAYCEDIVKKMMTQQEEIHSKLLHDMLKWEEEKIATEECWKKQQMERLHTELEVMAHEQAIAGDRQATIIEILNQITNSTTFSSSQSKKELQNLLQTLNYNINDDDYDNNNNNKNVPNSLSSSSLIQTQTSSPNKQQQKIALASSSSLKALPHENSSSFTSQNDPKNPKNPQILAPQDPNSFINHSNPPPSSIQKLPENPKTRDKELDDLGKRWPRDEVLALVNVRCTLYNNGGGSGGGGDLDQSSGGADQAVSSKAPLWERISQGMLQLGYKRSAKRCKEKWENINKYFRKTKDVNKKRSLDSRTCPYFHQLSTLYNQGGANKRPENCPILSPESHSNQSENLPNSTQINIS